MKYQRDSEKEKKKKKNRVDDTVTTSLYISPTFNGVKKKKREREKENSTMKHSTSRGIIRQKKNM